MNKQELKKELKSLGIVAKNDKIKKSDIQKVLGSGDAIRFLMKTLFVTLGNKHYLYDLEKILEKKLTELSYPESETLMYLARDVSHLK